MKKILLTCAAAFLAFAPSMAAEVTINWYEQGLTSQQELTTVEAEGLTFTFEQAEGKTAPKYVEAATVANSYFLLPKGCTLTVTAPAGANLESIKFVATGLSYKFGQKCNAGKFTTSAYSTDQLWEAGDEAISTVTFTADLSTDPRIKSLVINYDVPGMPANLSFPAEEFEATLGEAFEAPELLKDTPADAVYTSSNPEVAEVDAETGAITLFAAGETVITATCEAFGDYDGGEASYKLIVSEPTANEGGVFNFVLDGATIIGSTGSKEWGMASDGFQIYWVKGSSTNNPAYSGAQKDIRLRAGMQATVTAPEGYKMTSIVFKLSTYGLRTLAPVTASEGVIAEQALGDTTVEWSGKTNEVTFTVGANADFGTNGSEKEGYLCFTAFDITYDIDSAVETIEANKGEATYYDLSGRQVKGQLVNGLYIRVLNGKATKVLVK